MEKIYFRTTLCWKCSIVYPMQDRECPQCHAANANVDTEKALAEMAAEQISSACGCVITED